MKIGFVQATRKNHAVEHATIAVLLRKLGQTTPLVGGSTPTGFFVYGDVPTDTLKDAAEEGLELLKKGRSDLAVSPFCGTNIVVAGVLTALSSAITFRKRNKLGNLPNVIVAATAALALAQPLGRLVQKYLTTDADLGKAKIERITRVGSGKWTVHKVDVKL